MAVRLREALASIPVYRPGETPDECGPASAAKLSSNESPWEPPAPVVEAVAKAAATLNRYPDFYEVDLCERLAERYGLDAGQVSVDNGSGSLLQDAVRIVCDQGDEVLYCTPTFAAYEIDVVLAGAKPKTVPLGADWRYDVAALQAAVTDRTRMAVSEAWVCALTARRSMASNLLISVSMTWQTALLSAAVSPSAGACS